MTRTKYAIFPQKVTMYKRLILVELILIEASRKPSLLSVSPTNHIRVSCTRIFNIINCSQPPPTAPSHDFEPPRDIPRRGRKERHLLLEVETEGRHFDRGARSNQVTRILNSVAGALLIGLWDRHRCACAPRSRGDFR